VKAISKLPSLRKLTLHIPTLGNADNDDYAGIPATQGLLPPNFNSAKSILTFVLREKVSPYLRKVIILVGKVKRPQSGMYTEQTWPEQYKHHYEWAPDIVGMSGVGSIREMVWDATNERLTPQMDYS
jgi:hypothetical protein